MSNTYLIAICGSCGKKICLDPEYYAHENWVHEDTEDVMCEPKTSAIPKNGTEKEVKRI